MERSSFEDLMLALDELKEFDCHGHHSSEEISSAEQYLGVSLPNSFKRYLKEFGNMAFGHVEYLGLTKSSDFSSAGFPNFVWFNLRKREQENFPDYLIIFRSVNDEIFLCLDTSKKIDDDDCVITIWSNLDKHVERELEIGFNSFLIGDIEEYIDLMQ
ncbi:SMI1/KNR4 family protein [Zooshikella sp. RANM57]|uniref:SMI1/KNR4 family protein n=1 Tax=Zooshikella sp. RANM57 TaxID=3425863 RepID=UPI003D700988